MDSFGPGPNPKNPQLPRSPWVMLMFALPLVGILAVFVLYGGTAYMGVAGRGAYGQPATLHFEACAEAGPVVLARLDLMGLHDRALTATTTGFDVTLTLPGQPEVDAALPSVLATTGELLTRPVGGIGPALFTTADKIGAQLRQDLTATPWTMITLNPAAAERVRGVMFADPEQRFEVLIDGKQVAYLDARAGTDGDNIEYLPEAENDLARLHLAAAQWVILAEGPLPCPVTALGMDRQ